MYITSKLATVYESKLWLSITGTPDHDSHYTMVGVLKCVTQLRHKVVCCKTWGRFELGDGECMSDPKIHQSCIFLIDHWSPYATSKTI